MRVDLAFLEASGLLGLVFAHVALVVGLVHAGRANFRITGHCVL